MRYFAVLLAVFALAGCSAGGDLAILWVEADYEEDLEPVTEITLHANGWRCVAYVSDIFDAPVICPAPPPRVAWSVIQAAHRTEVIWKIIERGHCELDSAVGRCDGDGLRIFYAQ